MNIFRNALKITLVISSLFLLSCKKDKYEAESNTLTNEIGKVETIYKAGDIKIESIGDGINKELEFPADENTRYKIMEELRNSYSKKQTFLKSASNPVGVIQNGWCNTNTHLEVFMDCEDSNDNSWQSGSSGNIIVDGNGNITYNFCVVDGSLLNRTNFDYAVLDLSGLIPVGVIPVKRYFDNEDNGNANSVKSNGIDISGYHGGCYFAKNIQFGFQFFPALASSPYVSLPDFNIGSYFVFGKFGTEQGTIYSDDENDGNANSLTFTIHAPETNGIPNVVEPTGLNTTLHVSKAL